MATDLGSFSRIESKPEFSSILREEVEFSSGAADSSSDRINRWFDDLMLQSGLGMSPAALLMLCLMSGVLCGGLAFVIQENLLTTAVGLGIGVILPVLVVVFIRNRRQKQILDQIPPMVEELARASRTGRSLEQCFQFVAEDIDKPLGDELKRCARKLDLGISLPEAIRDLPERTGVVGLTLFVTALSVHHQTGGDLVSVLERLARAMRERTLFLGRLRASTTSSRATAVLMLVLPPAVLLFFAFRDPGYIDQLFNSVWGRNITTLAFILQLIGTLWVRRVLKSSQRA